MRRLAIVGAICSMFLLGAAPVAAGGVTIWHATLSGPVLHGGATVTQRPAMRARLTATVSGALPGTRPVMELVGAACRVKGPVLGAVLMAPASKTGVSGGLELLTLSQTSVFDGWITGGTTVSVHVIGRGPNEELTQACGDLAKQG